MTSTTGGSLPCSGGDVDPSAASLGIALGGIPLLVFPAVFFRALLATDWKRLAWLAGSTVATAAVLAVAQLALLGHRLDDTQHYAWSGWWLIFFMGASFVGARYVLVRLFGPVVKRILRRRRGTSEFIPTP